MRKGDEPMKHYEDFINGIQEDVEVSMRVQARIEETLSNLPENETNYKKKSGRSEQRSWMSTAAAAILVIMVLSGCAVAGEYLAATRVHVLVTGSPDTGNILWGELMDFEKVYEEEHPDIDIVVTLLSDKKNDQTEARMKKMRTEIMAGDGYDLYFMTGRPPYDYNRSYLFPNANKAMQSGVFASLDKYMKKDERWEEMELIETAMEAGTYQGKQYIIPLGINFQMFRQEKNNVVDYSKAKDLNECLQIALNTEDINVIYDFTSMQSLSKGLLLEPAADYDTNQMLMEKEPFIDYVTYAQNATYAVENPNEDLAFNRLGSGTASYLFHKGIDWTEGKEEKPALDFQSVPGIQGMKVGYVESYGAVGMNSTKKEAAYDFLISFMNRERNPIYTYSVPVNLRHLKEALQFIGLEEVEEEEFLECCNNLDQVVFLSEGSSLTNEKLAHYLSGYAPRPESNFEETVSKIYDEVYQTYETILKE